MSAMNDLAQASGSEIRRKLVAYFCDPVPNPAGFATKMRRLFKMNKVQLAELLAEVEGQRAGGVAR